MKRMPKLMDHAAATGRRWNIVMNSKETEALDIKPLIRQTNRLLVQSWKIQRQNAHIQS
jgi:hypothetical protein